MAVFADLYLRISGELSVCLLVTFVSGHMFNESTHFTWMCDSLIRGSDIEPLFVEFTYFEIPCRSIIGNPFSEIILKTTAIYKTYDKMCR